MRGIDVQQKTITLTKQQAQALAKWADQLFKENGTTAWGPYFSAALDVAKNVRKQVRKNAK